MQDTNPNVEMIKGLRELADFFEAHPELPECCCGQTFNLFVRGTAAAPAMAKFAKIAGYTSKGGSENHFWLRKSFSGGVNLDMNASRQEVCERVQVGTTVEPEHVIPAQPEIVVPAREVPVFEWRCGSILAESDTEVAA